MKKQKNVLISYILFDGGFLSAFLSFIFLILYTIVFDNYKMILVHCFCMVLVLLGTILPFFAHNYSLYFYFSMYKPEYKLMKSLRIDSDTGFIQGVPNNNCSEFLVSNITKCSKIELKKEKGIYIGKCNGQFIRIDMKGWLFKDKYVYELLQTYFIIEYLIMHRLSFKYVYKKINNNDINEVELIFINGKKRKKYKLSSNGKIRTKLTLRFKNYNKCKFIDGDKYSIRDFYSLNKNNKMR